MIIAPASAGTKTLIRELSKVRDIRLISLTMGLNLANINDRANFTTLASNCFVYTLQITKQNNSTASIKV